MYVQNNPTVAAVAAESVASGVASLSDDCNLMHLEIPKPQAQTWSMSQATITSASITPACTKSTMSTASNNANEPVQTILSASDRQTGLANPGTFGVTAVGGIATIATVPTTTLLAPNQLHHIVSMPQVPSLFFSLMVMHELSVPMSHIGRQEESLCVGQKSF